MILINFDIKNCFGKMNLYELYYLKWKFSGLPKHIGCRNQSEVDTKVRIY